MPEWIRYKLHLSSIFSSRVIPEHCWKFLIVRGYFLNDYYFWLESWLRRVFVDVVYTQSERQFLMGACSRRRIWPHFKNRQSIKFFVRDESPWTWQSCGGKILKIGHDTGIVITR